MTKGVEGGMRVCDFCGGKLGGAWFGNRGLQFCSIEHDKMEAGSPGLRITPKSEAVPEAPTFAYQLAMYLTRNGADAPHMQAEINRFLYDGKWKTTQGGK